MLGKIWLIVSFPFRESGIGVGFGFKTEKGERNRRIELI
jgi:hypothetical protein